MALNPITLAEAISVVATELKLDTARDRDEIIDNINRVRELLYNEYGDGFKLFDDYKRCLCIQEFVTGCENSCMTVTSVTLPDDMDGVVAAWRYDLPLTLKSRWREAHVGLLTGAGAELTMTALPEVSATEIDPTQYLPLSIFTEKEDDCGKVVTITGRDCDGQPIRAEMKLESDGIVVSNASFRTIESVVLPALCGEITLSQGDVTLSTYYPHERIPQYRRYRVSAGQVGRSILVQGTRKYEPVYRDSDIVELGGRLALEHGVRYFRFAKGSLEQEENNKAEVELARFRQQVNGMIARKRGRSVEDGPPRFKGSGKFQYRRRTLPGYRR